MRNRYPKFWKRKIICNMMVLISCIFRLLLYKPLQHLHDNGINVAVILCEEYSCRGLQYIKMEDWDTCKKLVPLGISLGNAIMICILCIVISK